MSSVIFVTKNPEFYDYVDWEVAGITLNDNLSEVVHYCNKLDVLDFDTETNTLHPWKGGVLLVVLGDQSVQFVIDTTLQNGFTLKEIFMPLKVWTKKLRGANLKFDLKFLGHSGIPYPKDIWDVMIAEQTITKGTGLSCSLDNIVQRRLSVAPLQKAVRNEFPLMSNKKAFFYPRHIHYAAEDAEHLYLVQMSQERALKKYDQESLAYINMQTTIAMSEAEIDGVLLDVEAWKEVAVGYERSVVGLEKQMDELLAQHGHKQPERLVEIYLQTDLEGRDVMVRNLNKGNLNYNSLNQLTLAMNKLGWLPPEDSKTGKPSFAKDTMADYVVDYAGLPCSKFISLLREYKVAKKRTSSFGLNFLIHVKNDGAIHAEYGVNKTETGRFSCSNPNLQQIPRSVDFRKCFIAREGYKILTADYSSAELRILADFSGDTKMIEILDTGGDLHGYVAMAVFRRLRNDPTIVVTDDSSHENSWMRAKIKTVIFSKLYGAGLMNTAYLLECNRKDAEMAETAMREALPQAFAFLDKVGQEAVSKGYIVFNNVLNQRRYFPECYQTDENGKRYRRDLDSFQEGGVVRKAMNAPIQGTNGEMIKTAITVFRGRRDREGWSAKLLMQIHDELVFEIRDDENLEHVVSSIIDIMNRSANRLLTRSKMKTGYKVLNHWTK